MSNNLFEKLKNTAVNSTVPNMSLGSLTVGQVDLDKKQFSGLSDDIEYYILKATNSDQYEQKKTVLTVIAPDDLEMAISQGMDMNTIRSYPAVVRVEFLDVLIADRFSEGQVISLKDYDWVVRFKQQKRGDSFVVSGVKVVIPYD